MAGFFSSSPPAPTPTPAKPEFDEMASNERPGKFRDLTDFADWETAVGMTRGSDLRRVQTEPEYKSTSSRKLFVRQIVHIKDNLHNSRVHDRIMLIIRVDGSSFTCLTFCRHDRSLVIHKEHCLDHAVLTTEANEKESAVDPDDYFRICVELRWGNHVRKPKEGAFINLRELWHVESTEGITFGILGRVAESNWDAATTRIIEIFTSSLKDRRTSQEALAFVTSIPSEPAQRPETSQVERARDSGKEREKTAGAVRARERDVEPSHDSDRRSKEKTKEARRKHHDEDSRETGKEGPTGSGHRRKNSSHQVEKKRSSFLGFGL